MTGLSNKIKCISLTKCCRGSRSASSDKLLEVRVKLSRLGTDVERDVFMLFILLRARSSTRNRGESGKWARVERSLSVKSMAST